jgi:hypothetical protein
MHHDRNVISLIATYMIEIKTCNVSFATINTAFVSCIIVNEFFYHEYRSFFTKPRDFFMFFFIFLVILFGCGFAALPTMWL